MNKESFIILICLSTIFYGSIHSSNPKMWTLAGLMIHCLIQAFTNWKLLRIVTYLTLVVTWQEEIKRYDKKLPYYSQ